MAKLKLSQVKIKEKKEKKGVRQSLDYNKVCKQLKNKEFLIEYDKDKKELIIQFYNIRLPTLNELLSGLQYRKFEVWNYKKVVKEVMGQVLGELKQQLNVEYLFKNYVDLFIYRQGKKLIDNDSLPASFKYFIDSLTINKIIKDDNPDFIQSIKCYQKIDPEPMFILKLKEVEKENYDLSNPLQFMRDI